jgi:hypothetical protein
MHPFRWAVPGRTLASAVIAILIWTTLATAVVAAADKSFGATVQPAPLVAGANAGHDVPIVIIGPPDVLAALDGWGWTPGTIPADDAPVWLMQDFRDRFLAAYTSR